MKKLVKRILIFNTLLLFSFNAISQSDINPVLTTVPSLAIAPDARAGAMGDAGAATAPDVYSQYWNPAKYAFATSRLSVGLSYTPWMRKIIDDIALMNVVGYYKLGSENNQAISASVRYFSIGDINITDAQGNFISTVAPHEMAIDLGYSRKLTETFSGSVVVRYIRADYSGGIDEEGSAKSTFAADIAGYNESYLNIGSSESLLSFGFNISNIGGKITNSNGNGTSFIPTNLRLGTAIMYPMSDVGTLSLSIDANKLLVPTPPVIKSGESENDFEKRNQDYKDGNSISGIFKSFGDAPGGFSEEMKEIAWSIGAEYDYANKFKLRTGYYFENKMKGNRQHFTFGAGFKFNAFQLDAAYLLSTKQSNPLDQTLRLSLAFDIDALRSL